MTVEERIAEYIVKAFSASDAGKNKDDRTGAKNSVTRGPRKMGYNLKAQNVVNAIRLITTNKTMFNFYVTEIQPDQNGQDSIIVYFDFNIDQARYQVSFHIPYHMPPEEQYKGDEEKRRRLERMLNGQYEFELKDRFSGKGRPTRRNHNMSSSYSVRQLVRKFPHLRIKNRSFARRDTPHDN